MDNIIESNISISIDEMKEKLNIKSINDLNNEYIKILYIYKILKPFIIDKNNDNKENIDKENIYLKFLNKILSINNKPNIDSLNKFTYLFKSQIIKIEKDPEYNDILEEIFKYFDKKIIKYYNRNILSYYSLKLFKTMAIEINYKIKKKSKNNKENNNIKEAYYSIQKQN